MKFTWSIRSIMFAACAALAWSSVASAGFYVQTDRLAYSGAVAYFGNDEGARGRAVLGESPDEVFALPNRDASLFFSQNSIAPDANIFTVAWYYTTAFNTNAKPKDDPLGNEYYSGKNNPSNTPVGAVQLYDSNGSTDAFFNASFDNFNGTHYTTMNFTAFSDPESLSDSAGGNAIDDIARLWNGANPTTTAALSGDFLFWTINIQFDGLQGVLGGDGETVTATNHPTSVVGTFYAIFVNTSAADPASNGYYAVAIDFNLDNWARAQGNTALNGNFRASKFIAPLYVEPPEDPNGLPQHLPTPGAAGLGLLLMGGLGAMKRWRSRR